LFFHCFTFFCIFPFTFSFIYHFSFFILSCHFHRSQMHMSMQPVNLWQFFLNQSVFYILQGRLVYKYTFFCSVVLLDCNVGNSMVLWHWNS
jgi:hypothetical protein